MPIKEHIYSYKLFPFFPLGRAFDCLKKCRYFLTSMVVVLEIESKIISFKIRLLQII